MGKAVVCLGGAALLGWVAGGHAFEVTIQGEKLLPKQESESCIEIAGEYPGVRIEASEVGEIPQICFSDAKRDILSLHNVTFVSTRENTPPVSQKKEDPAAESRRTDPQPVVIEFRHTFPPGPNGLIMARAKIFGFFATATGVGVASGDRLHYTGMFSQEGQEDRIGDPFEHTVGEELESALFESRSKKRYLISGPRTLKGRLVFSFTAPGHKLTLTKGATVSIDTGSRFEDKLEEMEVGAAELLQEGEKGGVPSPPEEEEPSLEEELSF